jgi:hypothetical protein
MRKIRMNEAAVLLALALGCRVGVDVSRAGYASAGYDLQVVQSEIGLIHSSLSCQTAATWTESGLDTPVTRDFSIPSCQSVSFARLYLDIWGGTNARTARAAVHVNGTALPLLNFGGTSDAHPVYDAHANCVYGSGAGVWQLAFTGLAGLLKTDGTANTVSVTLSDPDASGFDGRMYGISLIAVYQDPSIDHILDYYLAEADGTMRTSPGTYGSPDERMLTLSGLNIAEALTATYYAGYTHGNTSAGANHLDQLYLNGSRLGPANNDVSTGDFTNYPPNLLTFNASEYLAADSTFRYTVNGAELGGTGDSYLRANFGVLALTRPIPEPSSVGLLAVGVMSLLARARNRRKALH